MRPSAHQPAPAGSQPAGRTPARPATTADGPGSPGPCRCLTSARDSAMGRTGRRRSRRGPGRGAGGRVRHGPELGLLPAPGARQGRPGHPGPAWLLASRTPSGQPATRRAATGPSQTGPTSAGAGTTPPADVTMSNRPPFVHTPRACTYSRHTRRGHGHGRPSFVTTSSRYQRHPEGGGNERHKRTTGQRKKR
jgi:hypothetical protein